MKSYIDVFYEILHKNSVKRRRMFSLLLVLSLFVSTSVLWELRDIGITMVNKPLCGMEEHMHTDECYEDVLVCGLEENEEHTHTPECYQRVLTCGMEEHIHTASCYTDKELPQYDPDDYDSNVVVLDMPEEDETEESFDTEEAPELQLGSSTITALDNETVINDLLTPRLFDNPVDNIARGIKFTLFDYYENDDSLEDAKNNYDMSSKDGEYGHHNIKNYGVNYGRNANDDILFFAYGTPPDHGAETGSYFQSQEDTPYTDANGHTVNKGDYIDTNGNYVDASSKVPYYYPGTPDKNNYAGDYNVDSYRSGNRPVQGIVNNTLTNGYPTINGSDHSLDYLFSDQKSDFKIVYQNVNYLLKERTYTNQGNTATHLVYNSNENYAYFDKSTSNFTLYDGTYHIINNDHHRAGDTNDLTEETYASANGYEMGIGFFPFNEYNPAWRDPNFNGNGFNHHFGLKMEAEFKNEARVATQGEDPIVFKYSGDDDMWVFVDGVLVLDIGGIHEPAEGIIDFTNEFVWVQDNATDNSESKTKSEILVQYPYLDNSTLVPDYVLPDGWNTAGNKWITKKLGDIFGAAGRTWNSTKGAKHTIQVFYLERGGCYSNLSIDMNLPTVKPFSVVKNVDYQNHYENTYDKQETGGHTYQFEIQELINGSYQTAVFDGITNPFYLKDGERLDVLLSENDLNRTFRVVEKNVDTEVFENVRINGIDQNYASPTGTVDIEGTGNTLEAVNSYNFTNKIRQKLKDITVLKEWDNQSPGSTNIYFKIYQTDSVVGSNEAAVTKPVEIGGTMTFVLNSGNNWQHTFSNLPVRYGAHIYTYSVEEINELNGYEAAYSRSENDNTVTLKITNRSINNSYIHVKKQWINAVGDEAKPVQLTLKRKKKPVSTQDATLQVRLFDPGGNLISSTAATPVYAGGSAEFALDVPDNVQPYKANSDGYNGNCYKTFPNTVNCQQLGDRLFRVSNLQAGANEVDIRIYTDNADDSLLLVHHSFTKDPDGWEANGGVKLVTSSNDAYAKGDCLLVKGKTSAYEGARLKLDPLKFKAGKTYTFNLGVFFNDRTDYDDNYTESNPDYVTFKLTFNDGFGNYKLISTSRIRNGKYNDGGWGPLVGTFTLPDEINPYGMYILVETEGTDIPRSFRMDEFFAIEGNKEFTCEPGTGKITIRPSGGVQTTFSDVENPTYIYNYSTMNNYDQNGWYPFGSNVSLGEKHIPDDNPTNYAIVVSGRDESWKGAAKNVVLQLGAAYHFSAWVAGHHENDDKETPHEIMATLTYTDTNGSNEHWIHCGSVNTAGNTWGNISGFFKVPTDVDTSKDMILYLHTSGTEPFEVWSSSLYTANVSSNAFTEPKEGYTLENGIYTANNSRYNVVIQEGSIATRDYENDADWSYQINLGGTQPWTWSQSRSSFYDEDNNYRYIYYIDSETVIGATHDVDYILLPIENNNVSANDAETPILVKNKNIRFKLPATGGRGTVGIYVCGAVLITMSLLSGYAVYRLKRRRE